MPHIILSILLCLFMLPAQASSYCCNSNGRHICGDPLPPACYDRAYREVSPSGRTVREIDAPLSAEEFARKEAQERTQRAQMAREEEQRRRDEVLLETFVSVADIDKQRDRELVGIDQDIRLAREREAEILKERTELEKKLPPASSKTPPSRELAHSLAENTAELKSIRWVITSKQHDRDAVRARFDKDRKRYVELTQPHANN